MKLNASAMVEHFESEGYVVVPALLDWDRDLRPVFEEYERVLDGVVNRWQKDGHLTSAYPGLPFGERLTCAVAEAKQPYDRYFDICLPQGDVTETTPMHLGPAVFGLLRNPKLLDAVEEFIGPEIYSSPIQHARIKLPEKRLPKESRSGLTAQIGWHQDVATVVEEADGSDILTVWFPMTKAGVENGCLAVVPGSHHHGLAQHCLIKDQVCIPDHLLTDEFKPLPMEPGDVLIMHRRTKHAGLPNQSDSIRWSFDLRYQPVDQPSPRPWFPGFVARSRSNPENELRDPKAWMQLWMDTRRTLATDGGVEFYRWKTNDPMCA
jgi:phytanoyl-CoA hydroxylase